MKPAVHQYEDKLLEFAYGELPRPEAEAVDAHVRNCPRCTEALGQIREVRTTMGHLPLEAAPATGLESLMAYAEQTAKRNAERKPKDAWWRRLIMPMATVAALAVVGVVAWRANDEFKPNAVTLALDLQREREAREKAAPAAPTAAPAPVVAKAEPAAVPEQPAEGAGAAAAPKGEAVSEAQAGRSGELAAADLAKNRKAAGPGAGDEGLREKANAEPAPPPAPQPKDFEFQKEAKATPMEQAAVAPAPERAADGFERSRGSMTKRESKVSQAPAKKPAANLNKRDDWSNAAQRGALRSERNDGTTAVQALEGNAVGGALKSGVPGEGGPALGLSTGATGAARGGGQALRDPNAYVPEPVARPTEAKAEEARRSKQGASVDGKAGKKKVEPPPPAAAPAADDFALAFGTSEKKKGAKKDLPPTPSYVQDKTVAVPPAQRPVVATVPQAANVAATPPASAAPAPRSSLGLSLNAPSSASGSGGRASSRQAEEDELLVAGEATVDRVGVDRDAAYARRQRSQEIDARLKQARAAGDKGDHLSEVKLCLEVLENGAEGYQRVEALKRACDGFEALGEFDRAQPFCDRLVKEFGSTAAARSVIDRRKQRRLAPKDDALESERKPAEPAKATTKEPPPQPASH